MHNRQQHQRHHLFLSHISAGSYAENLPIFHLVGMPASGVQKSKRLVHHTLGNGDFDIFYQLGQHTR